MTKIHEEFLRGPIEDLIEKLSEKTLKGEATVLIKGSK
jgi:16S rRNA C1402 (ribose-2'-O) methylase RsmI